MERFEPSLASTKRESKFGAEPVYAALQPVSDQKILEAFTPEQQEEIQNKQRLLSSLAFFIGKDFKIPVLLNQPGKGWHWDFKNNVIRIDPKDLLEKPMDYLRFVICHEGGHRRISRTDAIPLEEWRQPGFAFMMNAIEDPRDNNFVAESYPTFREHMELAYRLDLEAEAKAREQADQKLGFKPRFMQAGYELIRQWFYEVSEQTTEIRQDLPEEVKTAVTTTLKSAQESWWRYPSRQEADESEALIRRYAQSSYEINRDRIWPEFKKLVAKDLEDQMTQEFLKDQMQSSEPGRGSQDLPQDLKDKLTPEEQKQLGDAIDEAKKKAEEKRQGKNEEGEGAEQGQKPAGEEGEGTAGKGKGKKQEEAAGKKEDKGTKGTKEEGGEESEAAGQAVMAGEEGQTVDLGELSEELKKKIKEYLDSLPEEEQAELVKRAEQALGDFEQDLNEEMAGKLSGNPESKAPETGEEEPEGGEPTGGGETIWTGEFPVEPIKLEGLKYKERPVRSEHKDAAVYKKYHREVLPMINKLENELKQVLFKSRRATFKTGSESGVMIDLQQRIQEKARGISAMESRAWQVPGRPKRPDYAITLLNDLSGSMRGQVMEQDFKAKIVLTEVLNKLGLKVEILGFNDEVYEYQKFGSPLSEKIREHLGGMFKEVDDSCCHLCGNEHQETDMGYALQTAMERLGKQRAERKMLIVLSDGEVNESTKHPRNQYNADEIKQKIRQRTDIVHLDPGSIKGKTVQEIIKRLGNMIKKSF